MQKKFLIKFLLFLFFFIPANSEIISGKALTIDGDTIKLKIKNKTSWNRCSRNKTIMSENF